MTDEKNISMLGMLMSQKMLTLTLKLPEDMLIEYGAAAKVLKARSISSLTHEYVRDKINEARRLVAPDEWEKTVNQQREETLKRSREKAALRKRQANQGIPVAPRSKLKGIPIIKSAPDDKAVRTRRAK